MDVLGEGETRLMVRFGVVEDFEDQPLPLTGRGRGMPWNAAVTTAAAHSGEKAIGFTGTAGHGDPQIVLKPNTAYRIEAWMKVEHLTNEELQANEAKARAALEKRRRSLRKKIERQKDETKRRALQQELADLPAFTGLAPPEAYVSGWFYEWSPHSGERLGEVRSNLLKPGSGWKKVSLQFTTPAWGPFIQLQFHATNCRAYLDDFHFRIAREAAEAAAGTSAP
jgi:hypothetical protein